MKCTIRITGPASSTRTVVRARGSTDTSTGAAVPFVAVTVSISGVTSRSSSLM
jgi:hypothetical protein